LGTGNMSHGHVTSASLPGLIRASGRTPP